MGAQAVLEGDGGGETFAKQVWPRGDVSDRGYREGVKEDAYSQRHSNRGHVGFAAKVGVRFFGVLGDGFEPSQEIRDDLKCQENGDERRGVEQRLKIGWGAAISADADEGYEDHEDYGGHSLLEVGA